MTTLELIARRRRTLADQLDNLPEAAWATPSLCQGWSVRDVVGHIVMPFTHSKLQVLIGVVRAGGNWHRFSDQAARRNAARSTIELVALLRDNADNPWAPPGGGHLGALTDLSVHSLDIARPCGIDPELSDETAVAVLDNLVQPRALKAFGVDLTGRRLEATDIDWHHGNGTPMRAAAVDLILTVTGRTGSVPAEESDPALERTT